VELERLDVFGPPPPEGTLMRVRSWLTAESSRHFLHAGELVDPDGRVCYRLTGVRCWRFYVPFGKVNFHGPKDEYFLSRPFPPPAPGWGLMFPDPPPDVQQLALRSITARVVLAPDEARQFRALKGPEPAKFEWLFDRLLAKDAVRILWHTLHG